MALQKIGTGGEAIKSKDLAVGDKFSGYLIGFVTVESKFGTSVSPKFKTEEGKEVVLWSSGNLKYLKENADKAGVPMGVYMEIESVEPPTGKNYKSYFSMAFDPDRVITVEEVQNGEF